MKFNREKNAMRRAIAILNLICALATIPGCEFQKMADQKFGDQSFKTAIALIELHRIRYGAYPESLKDIKFKGDWDAISDTSVEYIRLERGYELNIKRGWVGQPSLKYPAEFWQGLGLVKSNAKQ